MTQSGTSAETGTEITRFNALRHGLLSRYTVLPWEDAVEYERLVASLVAEHQPEGPTEEHLVEELAGVLWRKRRLRLAEAAAHRHGLKDSLSSDGNTAKAALAHLTEVDETLDVGEAVRLTPADNDGEMRDLAENRALIRRVLGILGSRRNDAYEAALPELREDTRSWWADNLAREPEELDEDEEPAREDAEALRRCLENEVLPWFERRKVEIAQHPLVREQALGESLDPEKLERLGRYEVHLDRKLERMLSMLLRLKVFRRPPD